MRVFLKLILNPIYLHTVWSCPCTACWFLLTKNWFLSCIKLVFLYIHTFVYIADDIVYVAQYTVPGVLICKMFFPRMAASAGRHILQTKGTP